MPAHFAPLEVALRSGRRVTLREARESDAQAFLAAWARLSEESRYTRFLSPVREASARMLERATHPDAQSELQLVAIAREGHRDEIVGGARYAGDPGARECEFAITIVDAWQGQGLARPLMEALMQAARERGYEDMEGYILAGNASMLGLARKLGFESVPSPEGPAVRRMRCRLRAR